MSVINFHAKEIAIKLVYYGPGLGGKTTSLQWLYQHLPPERRPEMVSLATEVDRTIFFDFMPVVAYKIRDYMVRLQLYTVPGQVFYNATRKLVLNGVDGIIFVADSQSAMQDANMESLQNLYDNLGEIGIDPAAMPLVFQYNKRDLQEIDGIADMDRIYNPKGMPAFATIATSGVGLMDALRTVSQAVMHKLKDQGLGTPERVAPSPASHPSLPQRSPASTSPTQSSPPSPSSSPTRAIESSSSFSASFAASQIEGPGPDPITKQASSSGFSLQQVPPEPPLHQGPVRPLAKAKMEDGQQAIPALVRQSALAKEQIQAMAHELGLMGPAPSSPSRAVQTETSYQGHIQLFPHLPSTSARVLQDALIQGHFAQVVRQAQTVLYELVGPSSAQQLEQYLWQKGVPISKWQRLQHHVDLAQSSPELVTQHQAMQALAMVLECVWS